MGCSTMAVAFGFDPNYGGSIPPTLTNVPICILKSVVEAVWLRSRFPPVSVGVITLQSGPGSEWIIFRWSKTA